MTEAAGPGNAFAVGDDTQYQPVAVTGDLRVPVGGPEGTGLLACHASGPLRPPRRAGVGHTAADVLAAERTREIVFGSRRGQPRA